MKKLRLFALSLMTVSFLTSCGGGTGGGGGGGVEPGPYPEECTLTINLHNCTVDNQYKYEVTIPRGATIDPVVVVPDEGYSLNKKSVPDYHYYPYWKEKEIEPESNDGEKAYVFRDFVLMHDLKFDIHAIGHHTLTLKLRCCKVNGEGGGSSDTDYRSTYTKTYNDGDIIEPLTISPSPRPPYYPDETRILHDDDVPSAYKPYWKESETTPYTYILSGLVMNQDHELSIESHSNINEIKLALNNCTVNGLTSYQKYYVWGTPIDPITVTPNEGYILSEGSVSEQFRPYWSKSTTNPGSYVLSGMYIQYGGDYNITINAGVPHTLKLALNNCYVEDDGPTTYTYREGDTINDIFIVPNDRCALRESSIAEEFQEYWESSEDKTGYYVLSGLVIDKDYEIEISAASGYMVTSEISGISISPSTVLENENYVGQLIIDDPNETRVFSESLVSAVLDDEEETSIIDSCTCTLQSFRKAMKIEIPASVISSDIKITTKLIDESLLWYKQSEWWNYCSSDEKDQRALEADVGKMVQADDSSERYGVRLIGVDQDDIANTNDKAHCTFDFVKLALGYCDGGWDLENNKNFINSNLNTFLQPGGGGYNLIPAKLKADGIIKTVTKHVEINDGSWHDTTYSTQLFPLSVEEINGDESTSYTYYKNTDNEKRKKTPWYSTSTLGYWLRSPNTETSDKVYYITHTGELDSALIDGTGVFNYLYVAAAFCI